MNKETQQKEPCTYKEVGSSIVGRLWETDCGYEFHFDEFPEASSWYYCPVCGSEIKEDPMD